MRYVVTGGAGYVGSRLVAALAERPGTETVASLDMRRPESLPARCRFHEADVTNPASVRLSVSAERPDAIVHLAFAPADAPHQKMYEVAVGGTNAVLDVAAELGVRQVAVASSATAYGAFPDNPVPITEDVPVRGESSLDEARIKAVVDRLCQLWAVRHEDRAMTIVRPCTVSGPDADPGTLGAWIKRLLGRRVGDGTQELQFVHVDDLVAAFVALLEGGHGGVFNVAGEGTVTLEDGARAAGIKRSRLPGAMRRSSELDFARYPWIVSTERLRAATGWEPRYTSRAALEACAR